MAQRNTRERQMRERLAQEAAHILAETGSRDFFAAKRKAAEHLGAVDTRNMPSNKEIEAALMTYQRLFRADHQPQELRRLRQGVSCVAQQTPIPSSPCMCMPARWKKWVCT